MPPQFYENGAFVRHPLEAKFSASGWDILSAIEKGFRAKVDVKGKLAEYFLYQHLVELRERGIIDNVEWRDKDGIPDFRIDVKGVALEMECKNVRSGKEKFRDAYKVEIQKTRSQIGGGPVRGYRFNEFQVLAACLFNQTGRWEYLFTASVNLARRPEWADYLVIMQRVPYSAEGHWKATIEEFLQSILEKQR
ncbi:MAG TPA: hypothetical protein VGX70_19425 [Gemmataceae bacterium]|jgi:hypothetical protein|nr:hypothetical protein [Gemmataceae bacterium]